MTDTERDAGGAGPLAGVRAVEFSGLGATPFGAMMLADMGADVIRIDRAQPAGLGFEREPRFEPMLRGRRSIALDLKQPAAIAVARKLIAAADCLIEGFRPGVMERLGLGPDDCLGANPRLVYGRMTGFGQSGPLSQAVGHDINYLAVAGVLGAIGHSGAPPVPPLTLVGDMGGGGMYLAFGIVCALLEARRSGRGQVVDAAMVEGASSLATTYYGLRAAGLWSDARGDNLLDGGAPWYDAYETLDGRHMAVGAIEPRFYAAFVAGLGLDPAALPKQDDRAGGPALRQAFAAAFRTRTRDEWTPIMAAAETCCMPVLSLAEAAEHEHAASRASYLTVAGVRQPAPAPRFSRTPGAVRSPPARPGEDSDAILAELGLDADEIAALRRAGAVVG